MLVREYGFLRIHQIIGSNGLIPISKSSWYAGIQAGIYPKPVKLGAHTSVWRAADIEALIARIERGEL